jgi:hypothetical protein
MGSWPRSNPEWVPGFRTTTGTYARVYGDYSGRVSSGEHMWADAEFGTHDWKDALS